MLAWWRKPQVIGESYDFKFSSRSVSLGQAATTGRNLVEQAVHFMRRLLPADVQEAAQCAEWWGHRRPEAPPHVGVRRVGLQSHPLHWDNDGADAAGNPLATAIFYLTAPVSPAAPTVVLRSIAGGIDDAGWVLHASEGRVAVFRGDQLHGVLPSAGAVNITAGASGPLRMSMNVAWWPHRCKKRPPSRRKQPKRSKARNDHDADPKWEAPPPDAEWGAFLTAPSGAEFMVPSPIPHIFCGVDNCGRQKDEL